MKTGGAPHTMPRANLYYHTKKMIRISRSFVSALFSYICPFAVIPIYVE